MNATPGAELLVEGELTVLGRIMPASNQTFLCRLGGPDGPQAVYKPTSGERPLWDFEDGTLANREYAAWVVSEALGWSVVPPTVLREGPAGPGMVQLWCEPDPAQEPVDLTHLLLEAVSDARVVGPDHHWRLELPETPLEVTGDEQRLHQVVTNLLTNARKHTPAGTTVTVTGRPDGFDVHDDGPGFPPGFVDKAFERFARVDEARERTGGAGLGLALVEAIVRSHGGTVSLASAPGGTTIAVRLR